MDIKLSSGKTISGYSYTAEGTSLKIRFLGRKLEDVRKEFVDPIATKKIEIEEKTFTGYEVEYFTEYTGGIGEVGLKKPEETDADNQIMQAVVTLAKMQAQDLDDEAAQKVKNLFPEWDGNGTEYAAGQRVIYGGVLYSVIQEHTSQADWDPEAAASLFRKLGDPEAEIREWIQPTGAHDAYNTGDQVTHGGKTYESIVDANVWEPGVYGWKEI